MTLKLGMGGGCFLQPQHHFSRLRDTLADPPALAPRLGHAFPDPPALAPGLWDAFPGPPTLAPCLRDAFPDPHTSAPRLRRPLRIQVPLSPRLRERCLDRHGRPAQGGQTRAQSQPHSPPIRNTAIQSPKPGRRVIG